MSETPRTVLEQFRSQNGVLFDQLPKPTDRDRMLVQELMGDRPMNKLIIQYFFMFSNFVLRDQIFDWLLKNKLTGSRFIEFLGENRWLNPPSYLGPAKYILMRIKKESETSPIFAGRDFVVK